LYAFQSRKLVNELNYFSLFLYFIKPKLGAFYKKNDLDIEKIKKLVEMKEMFKKVGGVIEFIY